MSITFAVQNVLESTDRTTTVSNATTSGPGVRLYDRDRSLRFVSATSNSYVNITSTGTAHAPVDFIAVVNHNMLGTSTGILFGSVDAVTYTSVAVFNTACADPYYTTLPALSTTYLAWRVQFPCASGLIKIGELLLGCGSQVAANPGYRRVSEGSRANRSEDESPGGYVWSVQRGAARATLEMGWNAMSCADWTSLSTAWAKSDEGTLAFLLTDYDGIRRWVRFREHAIASQRVTSTLRDVATAFTEAV